MAISRRKISAVAKEFRVEISQLERLDAQNQTNFSSSSRTINKNQLHFLTESIFLRAFRAYEKLVRDVFILYSHGVESDSGKKALSYINSKSFLHAEILIKSERPFLDWGSPDNVIKRAETYLKDGEPIKLPLLSYRGPLIEYKKVRNHIAHDSKESFDGYITVLRKHFGTVPLTIPCPGAFLLQNDRFNPNLYKLQAFFDILKNILSDLS